MSKNIGSCGQFARIIFLILNIFFVVSHYYKVLRSITISLACSRGPCWRRHLSCHCRKNVCLYHWQRVCFWGSSLDCLWCGYSRYCHHWSNCCLWSVVASHVNSMSQTDRIINSYLFVQYSIVILLVVILELVAGILGFVFREQLVCEIILV